MTKGRIFAYRRDRLGGRLRSMVNAMRVAEWSGCQLTILWPVGRYAQELANPEEFFDKRFVAEYFEQDEAMIEAAYDSASHIGDFENFREIRTHLNQGNNIVIENTRGPIKLPSESQKKANLAFIETAQRITPSKEIKAAIRRIDKLVGDRKAKALHVRRGDIIQPGRWSRTYWPTKYVPDDYYDVMIEADPDAAFLLFSDTPETLKRFQAVHGIKSAAAVLKLDKMQESQRDFAELLAISRCEAVIASSDSAFSSAATDFGGAKKISLPDNMPKKMRVEAEQRLISRVEGGAKTFLNRYDYGQCARRVIDIHRDEGRSEKAGQIVERVVDQGWELPFITREFVHHAVLAQDDLSVLKVLQSEQNARKLRRSHFIASDLLKHTLRRSLLAAFAYAGLGDTPRAAVILSNLALCQTTIGPLDILSTTLGPLLTAGHYDIPPTTCVPFFEGQQHPRGVASLMSLNDHYQSRFQPNSRALNWQTGFDLDWREIGVNDRPMPREPQLRHIVEVGKQSDDPMKLSLAAIAMLRFSRLKRAKALMAKAERSETPKSTLNRALLLKRRAQVAEAAGNPKVSARNLAKASEMTSHPAFIAYEARFLMRMKDLPKAREIIQQTSKRPFYVSWLNYELFAQRHQVCENREEMRQEILDHFWITLPDTKAETKVA